MPCLIPEILFEIGKKLIEDGNSDTVIQFALSGKQQFQAMENVFASATALKLYADHFIIGWENKLCYFPNNRLAKLLLNSNGNRVDTLFIEKYIPEYQSVFDKIAEKKQYIPEYQSVFDRIAEKKQLTAVYVSYKFSSNPSYIIDCLTILSSSLKNMTIPNCFMNEIFRDSFKLKSLTLTEFNDFQYLNFCCKTDILEFTSDFDVYQLFSDLDLDMKSFQCSPHLSSVKQMTFSGSFFKQWFHLKCDKLMDWFSSIEIFKFNIVTKPVDNRLRAFDISCFLSILKHYIKLFIDNIKEATKVPPKINVTFLKVGFMNFDDCKFICQDFDVSESNSTFYCFEKTIKSAGSESTILGIQIAR
uniref:Uncharacterized protein n=1 Tax=Panagrolaimus sp. PS1159 TaxID=55785 RepID=A0AC35F538_9BILA